jgi:N-acetylmuramoyl-L-alanine amidase
MWTSPTILAMDGPQPLALDDTGPAVRDVQSRLADLGLDVSSDEPAVFGSATQAAVRAFQRQRGLTADGRVGPETWRALVEAGRVLGDRRLYFTEPMLRGDDVRELQRRLNRLGFDAGTIDGVFGPQTEEAVREFQANAGLRVDGIVGTEVVAAIRRLHRGHQSAPAALVREREALRTGPRRQSLAGTRILLDPALGPDGPGATAPNGRPEHEICWEIASRLEGRLLGRGVNVILSRGPATTPSQSDRARLANAEAVDAVLSLRLNALNSPNASGAAAYYFGDGDYVSESGRRLAELCVDLVVARTGTSHCRAHASAVSLLRETRAPAVVVEPGFVTHPEDGLRLQDEDFQDQVAEALTLALAEHLTGGLEALAAS